MKDSGKREGFDSGAVRDISTGKPRPDLFSPLAIERIGLWLGKGAEKYTPRNWEQGMPISRCMESLERHIMKYKKGETDEDHMAAIGTNAMFILHFECMVALGKLPAELGDMPKYVQQEGVNA